MKTKVSEQGVVIPKQLLGGVEEVDVRKEHNLILIVPITGDDPIQQLGKHPVLSEVSDASEHHDRYIYGA